jgi:hypothetical protein
MQDGGLCPSCCWPLLLPVLLLQAGVEQCRRLHALLLLLLWGCGCPWLQCSA